MKSLQTFHLQSKDFNTVIASPIPRSVTFPLLSYELTIWSLQKSATTLFGFLGSLDLDEFSSLSRNT